MHYKLLTNLSILLITLTFVVSCSSMSSSGSGDGSRGGDGYFSDEDLAAELDRWSDESAIPTAVADGLFQDVHFEFDSAIVASPDREKIRSNADILMRDSTLQVEVEGHCDARGTNEYNLALGEERARAVASLMVGFGVSPKQISTISYGEELPLSTGNSEASFAQNRRAHFAVYRSAKKNKEQF